jgi:benzoyl-CoA reductase/2-hydroxyglutaryl-CoA dehydratase subunit BcrC/BadD/HgdB
LISNGRERIGFTTTIPVEVILAAGKTPVDLNNIFINDSHPGRMVDQAEQAGYPRNTCGWIKGLYSAARENELQAVISVMQGDCSNTLALMETLQLSRIPVLPFAFPFDRDYQTLQGQIQKLMDFWGVGPKQVEEVRNQLVTIRALCQEMDRLTWEDNLVSGGENHYFLVSSSDFNGSPEGYRTELELFLRAARVREPWREKVRLAYIGVPPIFTDFYQVTEKLGARVVFNEVQRQFSMPFATDDITAQYLAYTYPYGAFARLEDIQEQLGQRRVDGVIHYTQTFCFRQIEDMVFREYIKLPMLTLEGDRPGPVDARTRMRLEAFIDMLAGDDGRG